MKIIDKASWQIDGGMESSIVVAHFERIFKWLAKNDMLTPEGKEIIDGGIDESVSLHERLVTPVALAFLEASYDAYVKNNSYNNDENASALEAAYASYRKQSGETYGDEELKKRLLETDYPNDEKLNEVIKRIRNFGHDAQSMFQGWYNTAKIPSFDINGITPAYLRKQHNMKDVGIIIAYDWLSKEPEKVAYLLKKGIM
jgi:hypothetical protein